MLDLPERRLARTQTESRHPFARSRCLVGERSGRSTGTDCPRTRGGISLVTWLLYLQHTETTTD